MLVLEEDQKTETLQEREGLPTLLTAALLHGAIAFLVFLPFFLKGQLPLWSTDNLYGSYPVIVYSYKNFWQGFAGWLPHSLSGINFFGSVNNMTYSPLLLPVYLLPFRYFWYAIGAIQFLSLWAIGVLVFLFARRVLRHAGWGFFASLCYQVSQQALFAFQTFPTPFLHIFFLLGCWSIWTLGERRRPLNSFLVMTTSFLGLMLSGHLVFGSHFAIVLWLFFFYRHGFHPADLARIEKPTFLFTAAFLVALLLGSIRWLPFYESLQESTRLAGAVISDPAVRTYRGVHLFIPEIFGIINPEGTEFARKHIAGYGENLHESFQYYGILPALFLGLAFLDPRVKGGLFWKILSLFYLAYWLRVMPFAFAADLFFYPALHGGIQLGSALSFCILAGYVGKCLGDNPYHDSGSIFTRPLIILFTVVAYTMVIWHSSWQGNAAAVLGLKLGLFIPLLFLLGLYGGRNNVRLRTLFSRASVGSGVLLLGALFAYSASRMTPYGHSEIFDIAARANWISVLALAGLGIKVMLHGTLFSQRTLILLGILFGMAVMWPSEPRSNYVLLAPPSWEEHQTLLGLALLRLGLVFSIGFLIVSRRHRMMIPSLPLWAICCAIVFVDLLPVFKESSFAVCRPFLKVPHGSLYQPPIDIGSLDLKNYRVNFPHQLVPSQPAYVPQPGKEELSNITMVYGIPSYGGVNGQYSRRDFRYLESLSGVHPDPLGFAANSTNERFLDLVGARYDFRSGDLLERPRALSRFMLFSGYEVLKEDEAVLGRLQDPAFNPWTALLISEDPGFPSTAADAVPVSYTARRDDILALSLNIKENGLLLFTDSFHPGWQVFVDGVATPIYSTNFKFMSLVVPQGEHEVRFVFRPVALERASLLATIGLGFLALFTILNFKKKVAWKPQGAAL